MATVTLMTQITLSKILLILTNKKCSMSKLTAKLVTPIFVVAMTPKKIFEKLWRKCKDNY